MSQETLRMLREKPVDRITDRIRWGTAQRLEFIEFRLFWEGGVNRADITQKFGVSVPQASADLGLYDKMAPGNMQYNSSQKQFLATAGFQPKYLKPDADRYLAQLRAITDHMIGLTDTWIEEPPETDAMPIPGRRVDVGILKNVLNVIRERQSIDVHYHSMNRSRPDAIWRRITPHAFGHDGLRWHVRAFCHLDQHFKDFILSRCLETRDPAEPGADPKQDTRWLTYFEVILKPNPVLSKGQQRTIALDYGMSNSEARVRVRRALLYYFNKRLRLDIAKTVDKPEETPIVVANDKAFRKALSELSP